MRQGSLIFLINKNIFSYLHDHIIHSWGMSIRNTKYIFALFSNIWSGPCTTVHLSVDGIVMVSGIKTKTLE